MLIFVLFFLMAFQPVTSAFGAVFGSVSAIQTICTLLIFAFIALAVGAKWNLGWVCIFLTIVVMVAVEMLAPYESAVEIITTAFLALIITIQLKIVLNDLARRSQKIPDWVRRLVAII